MIKLLLIEDDLEFAKLIEDFLSSRNVKTHICDDPFKALVLNLNDYDLVLLDLGLPGIDGLEICKEIRAKSDIPIIISTARGSISDKVLGLGMGADDYLPKPYDPDELMARVLSVLRRAKNNTKEKTPKRDFTYDDNIRDVKYKGNQLFLTQAEFEVFKTLTKNYDGISSKEQLLESAISIHSHNENSLEMIISKIRQKIKPYSDKNI